MTAIDERPHLNGRQLPEQVPGSVSIRPQGTNSRTGDSEPKLDLGLLSAGQLDTAIAEATAVVERQDATALREAKDWDEIQAARAVDREHRIAMLEVERKRNAEEVRRANETLEAESKLADQELRDTLDANGARALLKRMTDPVAYLASQKRARRMSLALASAPAIVAVLIGAVQSQEAWSHLWNVSNDIVLTIALYGFEPLFTLPLVAIMWFEAHTPGGAARTMKESWFRKSDFTGEEIEFGRIKAGLLLASVIINVLPHLLFGNLSGVAWFAVPAAIVISLSLVPKLAGGFGQRILHAKTDAELGAPVGPLPSHVAKLARQKRDVELAIKNGTYRGQLDETTKLPSANGARKTLAELHGTAGMPDAQAVVAFMSIERGIAK